MTPEGKVKAAIKAIMKPYVKDTSLWYFMPVPYANAGVPDFVACVNGRFLGIEAKAGPGKMTALQTRVFASIIAAGGETVCVNENRLDMLRALIDSLAKQ